MPRASQYSDADILAKCIQLASQGKDPSYRNFRQDGMGVCQIRLAKIRTDAIERGELILPTTTAIRITPPRRNGRPWKPYASEPKIPTTAKEFLKRERENSRDLRRLSNRVACSDFWTIKQQLLFA
jgi:hypothetical protein